MAFLIDPALQQQSGPSVKSSQTGSEFIVRSRTWSEDITKNWNKHVDELESITDRVERYAVYFQLNADQLRHISGRFIDEVNEGLKLHHQDPHAEWSVDRCSLKLLDTCVTDIPTGREHCVSYALDFGGTNLRAVRAKMDGENRISLSATRISLRESLDTLPKGLLDKDATASQLFDTFASTIKELMVKYGDSTSKRWANVGFTFSFPVEQRTLTSAHLICWTKEFETGRNTDDKVEGMDVGALLNHAFWKNEVPAKQAAVLNDTTGTLLSCAYEKPARLPPCLIGLILGTGVNGCYFQEDAQEYGYKGSIINTELGAFNKGLPTNDVDLEIDFAHEANRGEQQFEKMVSGMYIGEICRRLVVKVYQKTAPELAWVRESMPTQACSMVLNDKDADLRTVRQVVEGLWEWCASPEDLKIIKRLFLLVFDRSAALAAALIAGMAKKTGRLQPAMGGLTVGIDGTLYTQNEWYAQRVRHHLNETLGESTATLIHLVVSNDGSGKGAAILAGLQNTNGRNGRSRNNQ